MARLSKAEQAQIKEAAEKLSPDDLRFLGTFHTERRTIWDAASLQNRQYLLADLGLIRWADADMNGAFLTEAGARLLEEAREDRQVVGAWLLEEAREDRQAVQAFREHDERMAVTGGAHLVPHDEVKRRLGL
jgi:hypothetical protein